MSNKKSIDNLKPFKKGPDSRRNVKGRPPVLPDLKEAIARLLSEEDEDTNRLEKVLNALYKKALKGDVRAAQELIDRGYGKPNQKVDMNIEPVTIIFERNDKVDKE